MAKAGFGWGAPAPTPVPMGARAPPGAVLFAAAGLCTTTSGVLGRPAIMGYANFFLHGISYCDERFTFLYNAKYAIYDQGLNKASISL